VPRSCSAKRAPSSSQPVEPPGALARVDRAQQELRAALQRGRGCRGGSSSSAASAAGGPVVARRRRALRVVVLNCVRRAELHAEIGARYVVGLAERLLRSEADARRLTWDVQAGRPSSRRPRRRRDRREVQARPEHPRAAGRRGTADLYQLAAYLARFRPTLRPRSARLSTRSRQEGPRGLRPTVPGAPPPATRCG
jgi:hypothetical protein